jgi:tRNA dimethylallyltransferase
MHLARNFDGTLINADSMQVYRDLHILTARPSARDEAELPHQLFGCIDAGRRCSAGLWHEMAVEAAQEAVNHGRIPVLVGGTGLYLDAFARGISPIPETPPDVRHAMAARMAQSGPASLHEELNSRDPEIAERLAPGDSQRIQRALEVVEATGTPLSVWQRQPRQGGWPGPVMWLCLEPPRDALYRLCEERFDQMMAHGALEEAAQLASRGLDRSHPAMRALGVPHLLAHLAGELDLESAVEKAKTGTRRYAKRQSTWFRHQVPDALRLPCFGFENEALEAVSAVREFLLTVQGSPS